MQPVYEFGGAASAPLLNLALANGFAPATYGAFMAPLTADYHAVSLPPRALWPGEPVPAEFRTWRDLIAGDLLAGMRAYDMRDVILMGHSFGAIASLVAALEAPDRVRALVMLDPTILPRPFLWFIRLNHLFGHRPSRGNAERAETRRDRFATHEEAFDYWRGKKLFDDWSDAALHDYVNTLIPDGEKLTLAWPRDWEAYIFRTLYTQVWRDVAAIRGKMPVLIVRGGESNTYLSITQRSVQSMLPDAIHLTLPGYGHLFPHAAPQQAAQLVHNWLRGHDRTAV